MKKLHKNLDHFYATNSSTNLKRDEESLLSYNTTIDILNRDLKLLDFDLLRTGHVLVLRFNKSELGHKVIKKSNPLQIHSHTVP